MSRFAWQERREQAESELDSRPRSARRQCFCAHACFESWRTNCAILCHGPLGVILHHENFGAVCLCTCLFSFRFLCFPL